MELFEYLMNNKDTYFSSEYFLQISTVEREITESNLVSIEKLIDELNNNENIEILDLHYEAEMLERMKVEDRFFTFDYNQWNRDRYRLKEDCFIVFSTDRDTYEKFIKDSKNELYILQSVNNDLIKSSNSISNVLENKMIKYETYDNEDFTYTTHPKVSFEIRRYLARYGINTGAPSMVSPIEVDSNIFDTSMIDSLTNDIRTAFNVSNDLRDTFTLSNEGRDVFSVSNNGRINFADGLRASSISIDDPAIFTMADIDADISYAHDADGDSTFIASRIGLDASNRPSITSIVADNISTSYISQDVNSITLRVDSRLDNLEAILGDATNRIGSLEEWRDSRDNQRR